MILREIIVRVQDTVDDRAFWDDTRLKAMINRFKDKMAQEMTFTNQQKYEFSSVVGDRHYEVPHGYISNHLLFYNGNNRNEIFIRDSPRDIDSLYLNRTEQGLPREGYVWGDGSGRRQLTIYPTFSSILDVEWWFYGWPEDLVGDKDELPFPIEWHPSLAEACIDETRQYDKEIGIADQILLWGTYIRKIRQMDVTKELVSSSDNRYASNRRGVPHHVGDPMYFNINTENGIW